MARLIQSKHHDRWHVHKVLGVYVLVHFLYRCCRLVVKGEGLRGNEWLSVSPHILLNLSSFLFALPKRRNPLAPMIWPAYRAHNLIFTLRNVSGALLSPKGFARRAAFVCTFMALADVATSYFDRQASNTTTRGMPYFRGKSPPRRLQSFYMQCQFHATIFAATDPTLSFLSVMPIQVASFAMTLARKQKISSFQWHLIYAACLWSLYFFALCRPATLPFVAAGFLAGLAKEVRHHLKLNKYLLWLLTIALHEAAVTFLPPLRGPTRRIANLALTLAAIRSFLRLGAVFFFFEGTTTAKKEDPDYIDGHDLDDRDDDDDHPIAVGRDKK